MPLASIKIKHHDFALLEVNPFTFASDVNLFFLVRSALSCTGTADPGSSPTGQ